MIKVKIRRWYPKFIVKWLVAIAIRKDCASVEISLNSLGSEWESKAWGYDD